MMRKLYIKIDGIHCSHCEKTIKKALLEIKNIEDVEFDGFVAILTYKDIIYHEEIVNKINSLDYFTKESYISNNKKDLDGHIKVKEFIIICFIILVISFIIYKLFGYNVFNVIPTIDSSMTYGTLFIVGILTSIHCISMCGAINLSASVNQIGKVSIRKPILYNIGRVLSYTLIGGIVGLIGSVLQINNIFYGIIILLASILMFIMSLNMLGIIKIKRINLFRYKFTNQNPFIIGLLNGFMPCGPLQAMQLYAVTTGSFIKGAFSMLLFGLGTFPLMLLFGLIVNVFKGKVKLIINKFASTLILFLSIIMLNRGLLMLDIDLFKSFNNYSMFTPSIIENNYQVIEIDLNYDNYKDIIVQKNIPVRMIIHVDKNTLTGCNNEIIIKEFNIKQQLHVGDNVIEFTPTKEGTFTYTCWMQMIKNTIKVIDDEKYFERKRI